MTGSLRWIFPGQISIETSELPLVRIKFCYGWNLIRCEASTQSVPITRRPILTSVHCRLMLDFEQKRRELTETLMATKQFTHILNYHFENMNEMFILEIFFDSEFRVSRGLLVGKPSLNKGNLTSVFILLKYEMTTKEFYLKIDIFGNPGISLAFCSTVVLLWKIFYLKKIRAWTISIIVFVMLKQKKGVSFLKETEVRRHRCKCVRSTSSLFAFWMGFERKYSYCQMK